MIALQLASFFLAVECLVCLFFAPRGLGSTLLAVAFFAFLLIFCWTCNVTERAGHRKAP